MREYAETLRTDPDNFTAHYNLGDLAMRLRRHDEAFSHFKSALRLRPESKEVKAGLDTIVRALAE
jgi:cytochrome c-type biogenesis protein CcmH/NrfG